MNKEDPVSALRVSPPLDCELTADQEAAIRSTLLPLCDERGVSVSAGDSTDRWDADQFPLLLEGRESVSICISGNGAEIWQVPELKPVLGGRVESVEFVAIELRLDNQRLLDLLDRIAE